MKIKSTMTAKLVSRQATIGTALGVLALGALAPSAHSQILNQFGRPVQKTVRIKGRTTVITVPEYNNSLSVSPYTVFQFSGANRDATGLVTTTKTTKIGPFIQYSRNYNIEQSRNSSVNIGAWYWYHGSDDAYRDRFALFTTYNFTDRISAQANAGGISKIGFTEYYGFLLYRYSPPARLNTRFNAVQVGVGPYFPRTSYGNAGYTATAGAGYDLTNQLSLTGNVWYVNYDAPAVEFGPNFKTRNSLTRLLFNLNYKF